MSAFCVMRNGARHFFALHLLRSCLLRQFESVSSCGLFAYAVLTRCCQPSGSGLRLAAALCLPPPPPQAELQVRVSSVESALLNSVRTQALTGGRVSDEARGGLAAVPPNAAPKVGPTRCGVGCCPRGGPRP